MGIFSNFLREQKTQLFDVSSLFKSALLKRPLGVVIDITDRCNLRCAHCYHSEYLKTTQAEDISFPEWERRFNYFRANGFKMIYFLGGEPALRQDVLLKANEIFPYIGLITNGTIKIDERFDHSLIVSLDGGREINDALRGKGVFDTVLKNYSGDKRAVLNMVITKKNIGEIPVIMQIGKFMKIKGVSFNIYTPNVGEDNGFIPDKNDREEILYLLHEELRNNGKYLLFTKGMINSLVRGDHTRWCTCRSLGLHFDVNLNARRCFARQVDCKRCGCYLSSVENPILTLITSKKIRDYMLS
ncbi:MAG: radical SAM protein [Candidatus Saganbacteria bacterium]|nr:radical SAM protein [Candidatus Saganbacteria bacterium]